MTFIKQFNYFICALVLVSTTACAVSRVSTTENTAVEEALLGEAVSTAIRSVKVSHLSGKSFFINQDCEDRQDLERIQCNDHTHKFALHSLKKHLLDSDLRLSKNEDDADIIVFSNAYFAAIDDGKTFIGIPSIPIPVPGATPLQTPELALFSLGTQFARVKFSIFAVDRISKKTLLNADTSASEMYYSRWVFLIFFNWRTSNLPDPF